jgi:CubicO group peptidase (beta-lactamase class C family)
MKKLFFIFLIKSIFFSTNLFTQNISILSDLNTMRIDQKVQEATFTAVDLHSRVINPAYIDSLKLYLKQCIADSAFPGCAIVVGNKDSLIIKETFGRFTYEAQSNRVMPNSIFDLASVTKVVATTTSAMVLYDRGKLQIDKRVQEIIPSFTGQNKDQVTIRHILTHTSGLPGWRRFYLEISGKENIMHEICSMDLEYLPGTKMIYSDLGMILLQKIIESVAELSLDKFFYKNIVAPLELKRTFFNPDLKWFSEIVPTEVSPWHKRLIQGYVHDENSYAMGGVAGHAGLFSTVEDLAIFCQMYLNEGIYKGIRLLRPESITLFTSRQNLVGESTRALGWDTRSEQGSSSGELMSKNVFGHTGFTGTSIWLDPVNQIFIVFLTNRVHPTRENNKIRAVRPKVHDYIMKAVLNKSQLDN